MSKSNKDQKAYEERRAGKTTPKEFCHRSVDGPIPGNHTAPEPFDGARFGQQRKMRAKMKVDARKATRKAEPDPSHDMDASSRPSTKKTKYGRPR